MKGRILSRDPRPERHTLYILVWPLFPGSLAFNFVFASFFVFVFELRPLIPTYTAGGSSLRLRFLRFLFRRDRATLSGPCNISNERDRVASARIQIASRRQASWSSMLVKPLPDSSNRPVSTSSRQYSHAVYVGRQPQRPPPKRQRGNLLESASSLGKADRMRFARYPRCRHCPHRLKSQNVVSGNKTTRSSSILGEQE